MNSDQIFDQLEKVAKASGHAKQKFLIPELMPYLVAAYDPYTMYYNKVSPPGLGNKVFSVDTEAWDLLRRLSQRVLTGDNAKISIHNMAASMTAESAELFNRILNKDLRIGMGIKSINKVFPGLIETHDVMLAKLFTKERVEFPCWGGPKIDGIRATYKWEKRKFFTRRGHEIMGLEHLLIQLGPDLKMDLDGELFIPGVSFQVSSGEIRSDRSTPNAVFAMFEIPGVSISFLERLAVLDQVSDNRTNFLRLKHYKLNDIDHLYKFYNWCRAKGHEGAVIRPLDYKYVGTRSWSWMKMKNIIDFDLKVIDTYEGKGKYKGQIGGLYVDYNGTRQKVGGGFSDMQRLSWANDLDKIFGKTIHVVVTEFTDDGNFRHARMGKEGIRWDK